MDPRSEARTPDSPEALAEEADRLRVEAAELLARSRWWRQEQLLERLAREWDGPPPA
jgi:hypothetical protein